MNTGITRSDGHATPSWRLASTAGPLPRPGPECTSTAQCTGDRVCVGGACVNCTLTSQCNVNRVCLGTPGLCVGSEACTGTGTQPECTSINALLDDCENGI
jgi:hypothetical protein